MNDVTNFRRRFAYWLGLGILALLFLRPYPVKYIGNLGVRAIDAILLGLVLWPPILARDLRFDRRSLGIAMLLLMVTALAAVTSVMSIVVQISWPEVRDLFETLRYLGLGCYMALGFFLGRHENFRGHHILVVLTSVLAIALVVSVLQKVTPTLVLPIAEIYSPERQIRASLATNRVTSLFGNPNTNGVVTLGLTMLPLAFVATRRPLPKAWMPAVAALTAASLYVVIISGSRTSFVTLVGVIAVVPLILSQRKVMFVALGPIALLFLFQDDAIDLVRRQNSYLADGLQTLLTLDLDSLLSEGTFAARFKHWKEAMAFFVESPLLGAGPLRSRIGTSTDNFYIYLFARYGVWGLGAFVLLWAKVIGTGIAGLRHSGSDVRFLSAYMVSFTAAVLIANLTIEAQIIPPIASLYFVVLGALFGCLHVESHGRFQRSRHFSATRRQEM